MLGATRRAYLVRHISRGRYDAAICHGHHQRSQLHLSSSHQVAVAHWRYLMGFGRFLLNSFSKAADNARVRPQSARGRRGGSFSSLTFFVPPSRPAWSPCTCELLHAVAEACSPQRFREENAVVRFISRALEPGDMYTSVFVYTTASVTSATARGPHGFTGVAAHSPLDEKCNQIQRCWLLYELMCRASMVPTY
jgi:hypothetical protein